MPPGGQTLVSCCFTMAVFPSHVLFSAAALLVAWDGADRLSLTKLCVLEDFSVKGRSCALATTGRDGLCGGSQPKKLASLQLLSVSAHFWLTVAQHLAIWADSAPKEAELTEQPQGLVWRERLSSEEHKDLKGPPQWAQKRPVLRRAVGLRTKVHRHNHHWSVVTRNRDPPTSTSRRQGARDPPLLQVGKGRRGLEAALLCGHCGVVVAGQACDGLLEAVCHGDEPGGLQLVVREALNPSWL